MGWFTSEPEVTLVAQGIRIIKETFANFAQYPELISSFVGTVNIYTCSMINFLCFNPFAAENLAVFSY